MIKASRDNLLARVEWCKLTLLFDFPIELFFEVLELGNDLFPVLYISGLNVRISEVTARNKETNPIMSWKPIKFADFADLSFITSLRWQILARRLRWAYRAHEHRQYLPSWNAFSPVGTCCRKPWIHSHPFQTNPWPVWASSRTEKEELKILSQANFKKDPLACFWD